MDESVVKAVEDLRRTLLDASLDLIAHEGLEGFSMREVARRAGVSHQAPYHHFADREAILAAIVAEGFEGLREAMQTALAEAGPKPAARLNAIGGVYVRFALANPAHFKLMFRSELVHAERHQNAKACAQSAFDLLVQVADEAAVARGGAPERSLVFAAWSLAHGLATLLLEGKLDQYFGAGQRARLAATDEILAQFARVFEPVSDQGAHNTSG
jgi:AcrR family transcriptional regulator